MKTLGRLFLLLLLGIVGSICVFYQRDILQGYKAVRIHHNQKTRKQQLREMCEEDSAQERSVDNLRNSEFRNFIVDDKHSIIYCYIPKVACTNWKRLMIALKMNKTHHDLMSIPHKIVHSHSQLTFLSRFPKTEIKAKLKHYTKFLFVRDPFVRLISAYRDKIQDPTEEYFYRNFARVILRYYGKQSDPPMTMKEAKASGMHVSFYNFIQYLLGPLTWRPFEPHWRPMHEMCHPCLIQYDFVGHQETLQEDAEHLLKILHLEHIKFPPHYKNMTTTSFVLDWFRAVPLEVQRKLYKIYEKDFKLFGYPKPVELLDDHGRYASGAADGRQQFLNGTGERKKKAA